MDTPQVSPSTMRGQLTPNLSPIRRFKDIDQSYFGLRTVNQERQLGAVGHTSPTINGEGLLNTHRPLHD